MSELVARRSSGMVESQAVYFFPSDYAGFWRRLAVAVVDIATVAILLLVAAVVVSIGDPTEESSDVIVVVLLACWVAIIYGYLVVLKRSRLRTLGYRLGRVRIVDAYNRRPGIRALTLRLSFAVLGPLNIVLDMLWIPSDRHKQSLRDKFAQTYVIRAHAQPAGRARVVLRRSHVMGMSFVFREIHAGGVGDSGR